MYNNNFLKFLETYDPATLRGEEKNKKELKSILSATIFLLAITLKHHEYLSLGFPDKMPELNQW